MGPWGKLECENAQKHIAKIEPNMASEEKEQLLDAAAAAVREEGSAIHLWQQFQQHVAQLVSKHNLRRWTASMELHNDTCIETQRVAVHCHMMWDTKGQVKMSVKSGLLFLGTPPYLSEDIKTARGRCCRKAQDQGHFYLSVAKVGRVFVASSHTHNKDFAVSPEWVTAWWQCGKISSKTAAAEYLACKRNLQRYLDNLHYVSRAQKQVDLDTRKAKVAEELAGLIRAPKKIDVVEDVFRKQFSKPMFRRSFLVLDGPSKMGKTMFAHALRGQGKTFECDCSCCSVPDLRLFDPMRHGVILFDEATPSLVIQHKKLFQGTNADITLASSATNVHAYSLWPYGTMMVVASNKWAQQCRELSVEDAEWISSNSVYYLVTEPLYT